MNKLRFLEGGGEMGELTRNYDWSKTTLGTPENWPRSLQNTVGLILHSAFPMFLFWGKDLLCFYNDAYRPSLGNNGKHPLIAKSGKEAWPDIWDFIGPLIEKVMTTGEAVWFEDQYLPIYRNGKMEDVYWTFSYSPTYGDDNTIAGVFVTCTETTGKVHALKDMEESVQKFRALVEQAPVGTCLFTGRDMKVEIINDIMVGYWGKGHTVQGKTLVEALPELKGQPFLKLLDDVYTTGEAYAAKGHLVELEMDGVKKDFYYDFTYKPVFDSAGKVFGIINVSIDATERVLAQKHLENNQRELLSSFEQAPVAVATISKENLTFRLVNTFYAELVGRTKEELEDTPLLEALPELKGQGFDDLLRGVIETGIPFIASEVSVELKRKGALETIFVDLTYQPQRDAMGEIVGVLVVATDVTQQVIARRKVEESEAHLQLTRDAIPAMVFYMDAEERYRSYNGVFREWFNVDATEALGKTTKEFIGENAYERVKPYLTKAYAGERVQYEMRAPQRIGADKWLNIVYTPHKNSDGAVVGVIVHATDVTQNKQAEIALRSSEAKFRDLIQAAPAGIGLFVGRDLIIENPNQTFIDIVGKGPGIVGLPLREAMPELITEGQAFLNILDDVYTTGIPFISPASLVKIVQNGVLNDNYYNISYTPIRNAEGEIYAILDIAIDVTEQVRAQQKVEESESRFRTLLHQVSVPTCVLRGPEYIVEIANEKQLELWGKSAGEVINKPVFEALPEARGQGFEALLKKVWSGETLVIDEMPVEFIRDGQKENSVLSFTYQPLFDSDNAVSGIISVAVEITQQVETRKKIEKAVEERTRELGESNLRLKRSNEELEQFAYIASHDLQEPLRKISTFTQMLEHSIGHIAPKSQDYISKIYKSTDRMTKLIRDVLAFLRIKEDATDFEPVDLNNIVELLKNDFELQIEETGASIETADLPVLDAIQPQMIQLFSNLLSNSLKYHKRGVKPVVKISASVARDEKIAKQMVLDKNRKYFHIAFSDNGIGFDIDHVDKIFRIFQRLHGKAEFEGTGIGLAICRRIVQSHQGHISAAVGENGGAVFHILLPAHQNLRDAHSNEIED